MYDRSTLSELIFEQWFELKQKLNLYEFYSISVYYPMEDEINSLPFLDYFMFQEQEISFPYIDQRRETMIFKKYEKGTELRKHKLGFMQPATGKEVFPDIVFVPLIAYNAHGYRLGYGGGFYDKTIHKLRQQKEVLVIGLGLDFMFEEDMPFDDHDEKMNAILLPTRFEIFE
jgi:5-formyltetrahydrofolate cyclo-ligase